MSASSTTTSEGGTQQAGCADDSAAGQLAGLIPLAIGIAAVIGLFNCVEAAGKLRGGGGQKGGRGVGASIQGSSYS